MPVTVAPNKVMQLLWQLVGIKGRAHLLIIAAKKLCQQGIDIGHARLTASLSVIFPGEMLYRLVVTQVYLGNV